MKKNIKSKFNLCKTTIAALQAGDMVVVLGGRISDDTAPPSSACPATKASFTCPKF